MELPDDLVTIVNEFSRPVTQPGWRNFNIMNSIQLHWMILAVYNTKRIPVIEKFVDSYDQIAFTYIKHQGFVVNLIKN